MSVGILHPGAMGATIGAACTSTTVWLTPGRSAATHARAEAAGIRGVDEMSALVEQADVIVSVCPPHAAENVSQSVADAGFSGIYVDANAVAPATARRIAVQHRHFVDGGIIGPPVKAPGTTRFYLSGEDATEVSELWRGSDLEVRVVDGGPGAASAVKVCFAANTKGTLALLLAIRALAEAEGVTEALMSEWEFSMPHLVAGAQQVGPNVAPKAWRFSGEMLEIAQAFDDASLPPGFHQAAADIFAALAGFKDHQDEVTLEEVLRALL